MASRVGINQTLCTVNGEAKFTSLDVGASKWKTGNIELATTATGQVVCVINYNLGTPKIFPLTNEIKQFTIDPNSRRCVISLPKGNISFIYTRSCDTIDRFRQILEQLKSNRKVGISHDTRPNNTIVTNLKRSPQNHSPHTPLSPAKRNLITTPTSRTKRPRTPRNLVGSLTQENHHPAQRPPSPVRCISPNPMVTPSHLRAAASARNSVVTIEDSEEESWPTERSPMLFTEEQDSGDKENLVIKTPRALNVRTSDGNKSAYRMRKDGGGSMFMASFQEKQLQMEERKENITPVVSTPRFYSQERRVAGYCASDALLQPSRVNANTSVKRTPGLMTISEPKKPYKMSIYTGWRQKANTMKTSQVALQGFSNLGNTCYMNAILQSLFGLECFTTDVLSADLINMHKNSLFRALASLLFAKQKSASSDQLGEGLHRVKQAISSTAERFSGFTQHDAQEFLCQCLDQLKEDSSKAQKRVLESTNAKTDDGRVSALSQSRICPIIKNFEFEVMHSIVCKGCGEVVTKAEQFYDISLDMPRRCTSNPIGSIQTALKQFFGEEPIEYACSECDCKKATVTHKFTKTPRVFIIHLKRYRFDVDAAQNAKLRRRILIPKYLSVQHHCTKDTVRAPPSMYTSSDASLPSSLPSSPRRVPNGLRVSAVRDGLSNGTRQLVRPSRFSFTSLTKRTLDYNDGGKSDQTSQDKKSEEDATEDTENVLEISRKEAQKSQLEDKKRRQQEEEEFKKAIEASQRQLHHQKPIEDLTEEQQFELALAMSAREASMASSHGNQEIITADVSSIDVSRPSEISVDGEVFLSLKRRVSDSAVVDQLNGDQLQAGRGDAAYADYMIKGPKRIRTDDFAGHSLLGAGDCAGEQPGCGDPPEIGVVTSSGAALNGLTADFTGIVTPVKPKMDEQLGTPRSVTKSILEGEGVINLTGDKDSGGEAKPSYLELKAKEEQELRRATELSLQDAHEMEKKEEDALKRAKEISLQELSESFSPLDEEDELEPMDIDEGDQEDAVAKELAENEETGVLPSSYRLVSVVSHIGASSNLGHYISDVYDSKKDAWISYDDTHIVKMTESIVRQERERTGYIFFYIAK